MIVAALDAIAARHIGAAPGDHRAACPVCAKSGRDDAVNITVNADGSVVAHCHRCNENGTARATDRINGANGSRRPATRYRATPSVEDFAALWESGVEPGELVDHAYLVRKQVGAHGIRVAGDLLLIPMRNAGGELVGVQKIDPAGNKRYTKGAHKVGAMYLLGDVADRIAIAEGYSTGASVFEATSIPTVIAFDAGNMIHIAKAMRDRHPAAVITLAADDDIETRGNPGIANATQAALAVDGLVAIPDFGDDRPQGVSDFNDLAAFRGAAAVCGCIEQAKAPTAGNPAQSEYPSDGASHPGAGNSAFVRKPLDWRSLADAHPPSRDWGIEGWLGMGHTTLCAGLGGVGKTLLAQGIASALSLGRPYIDVVPSARRVLGWFAEDDHDELWRRQIAIAAYFVVPLGDFADNLFIESFADRDCTLMDLDLGGRLVRTGMLDELQEQIADYRADVIILDNSSRVFGGKEADRNQVTRFIAALNGVAGGAAVLLLAHPGRAMGSEYSGSSAWENAARARMFLSDKPPGSQQTESEDDEPSGDRRYLAKRKTNYSERELRTFKYENGLLVPEQPIINNGSGGLIDSLRRKQDETIILDGFTRLSTQLGQQPTDGASSPNYLPKLIVDFKLGEGRTKRDLSDAMRRVMLDDKLRRVPIGQYANRSPRYGLQLGPRPTE